jgi:hypothetical protein
VELFPFEAYRARVPTEWADEDAFLPLYQREAVWIAFQSRPSCPHAIEVGIGGVNAVSGDSWNKSLNSAPKNYLVSPPQPWFDGINVGEVKIRQFVAMPLGLGYTVEEQLTVDEAMGGIQIRVFAPKPGWFPAGSSSEGFMATNNSETVSENTPMGLAAGGIIEQRVYPDPYGVETWNLDDHGVISIHIAKYRTKVE